VLVQQVLQELERLALELQVQQELVLVLELARQQVRLA
jgi:hypothetical protein